MILRLKISIVSRFHITNFRVFFATDLLGLDYVGFLVHGAN